MSPARSAKLAGLIVGAAVVVGCGPQRVVSEHRAAAQLTVDDAPPAPSTMAQVDAAEGPAPVDPDSPAAITKYAIGDKIDPTRSDGAVDANGNVDIAKLPLWSAVGSHGVIVGYMKNLEALGWRDAEGRLPPKSDAGVIFDETGTIVIGRFVDGLPQLDGPQEQVEVP